MFNVAMRLRSIIFRDEKGKRYSHSTKSLNFFFLEFIFVHRIYKIYRVSKAGKTIYKYSKSVHITCIKMCES